MEVLILKYAMTKIKNKIIKLHNKYFGFFLLTIILTWVKTYTSYHFEFSFGVKGLLQHLIIFINPIGMTVLAFSLCLFRKSQKQSYKTLIIIYILNSFLLYANILYYREFSDFLTFSIALGAKEISEDSSIQSGVSTFLSLVKWYDFMYWIDIIILFVIGKKENSVLVAKDKKILFSKRNGLKVTRIALILILINLGMAEISRPGLLTRAFDRNYIVKYLGINGFTAYDAIKTVAAMPKQTDPTSEDIVEVLDYTKNHYTKPNVETFGIAKGRNVIAIHLESIEQFLIDYRLVDENGAEWEVLPFLNRLYHSEDTFTFPNLFAQIGQGKSCDAELLMETSLFGLPNGVAFINNADNVYYSFPKILKDQAGYTSAAFHGNVGSFWNRTDMYESLGYDYFFDADDFVLTEENIAEYGLKDKLFFMQSTKYFEQLQQPFYAKFITLSNHFPFPYDEDNGDIPEANTKDDTINGYFASSNYADQALEEFFTYLKEVDIYENSIFVLYGDHYGISETRNKSLAPLLDRDPETWTDFDDLQMQRVPLIIHIPGYEKGATIDTYGGQIDIMPTMLHLLGIDTQPFVLMGQDLLSTEKNETVSFRNGDVITPDYTIVSEDIYETKTGQLTPDTYTSSYSRAEMIYREANEQLRISDKILETDLLAHYRPSELVPIDTSKVDYSNDWEILIGEAEKLGKDNTSIYYKNDEVSTTELYQTDAPELSDTVKKMEESEREALNEENEDFLNEGNDMSD